MCRRMTLCFSLPYVKELVRTLCPFYPPFTSAALAVAPSTTFLFPTKQDTEVKRSCEGLSFSIIEALILALLKPHEPASLIRGLDKQTYN